MHDREVGRIAAWDGERGTIQRAAGPRGPLLLFTAQDVVEGEPEPGVRCTFTPPPRDGEPCASIVRVRAC